MNWNVYKATNLNNQERIQVMNLWNSEYPLIIAQESLESFNNYLASLQDQNHLIVCSDEGTIIGWYFDFIRDGDRNFAVLLDSKVQGLGLGTELLNRAKSTNSELHGWAVESSKYKKSDGSPYLPPIDFYRKLGFEIIPEINFERGDFKALKIKWPARVSSDQKNPT